MRHFTKIFLAILLLMGPSVGVARAATTAGQLVDLMRAGLSDEVLIALIQTDGSTFTLSATDIIALHRQGLSDKVILAMQATAKPVRALERDATGRDVPLFVPPDPVAPQPVVQQQVVEPSPQAVVNVYQTVTQRVEAARPANIDMPFFGLPVAVPVFVRTSVVTAPTAPVYWGWGGQRRPDSWQPSKDSSATKTSDSDPKRKGGGIR